MLKINSGIKALKRTIATVPELTQEYTQGTVKLQSITDVFAKITPSSKEEKGLKAAKHLAELITLLQKRQTYLIKLENRTAKNFAERGLRNLEEAKKVITDVFANTLALGAKFEARAKNKPSTASKLIDKARKQRLVTKQDFEQEIRDAAASRITLPKGSPEEIEVFFNDFIKGINEGKIKPIVLSNYHGKGTNPYLSPEQVKLITEACAKNGIDFIQRGGRSILKSSGYTCVQINYRIRGGIICELQIRGREMDKIAGPEHIFYKFSSKPEFTMGNEQLDNLLNSIREAIIKLDKIKKGIYKTYLRRWYKRAKEIEETGTVPPHPKLPRGIPKELSIQNLIKIYEDAQKIKEKIKNDINNMVV